MWACSRLKTCGQWFLNYPLSAPPFRRVFGFYGVCSGTEWSARVTACAFAAERAEWPLQVSQAHIRRSRQCGGAWS